MRIRTLIVDDEPLGRSLLKRMLREDADFVLVGECATGSEAVCAIGREFPDLVFLDVQMPDLNGFQVAECLPPDRRPMIIFVTAFDEFALKAFEAHAIDYLLKPLAEDRFNAALARAKTYVAGQESTIVRERLSGLLEELSGASKGMLRLMVEDGGRHILLKATDIDWIEAAGNYLNVHSGKQNYLLRGRVGEIEKRLSREQFLRIHRSTIVNLDRIKELQPLFKGEGLVVLKDGTQLAVSRTCNKALHALLGARF